MGILFILVIDEGEILYRHYIDVSVAVATPKGLVVPVLRNVETMNYAAIEKTLNEYAIKVLSCFYSFLVF